MTAEGIKCSPHCGFGCTQAAYDQATREAGELVAALGGAPWRAEVWENAGWCYAAKHATAPFMVTVDRKGSRVSGGWTVVGYTAWINGGRQVIERGETPAKAWLAAYLKFKERVRSEQEILCHAKQANTLMHGVRA